MSEKKQVISKHLLNNENDTRQEEHNKQTANYSIKDKLIANLILVFKFINEHKMSILILLLLLTPCVLALTPLTRREKNHSNEDDSIDNESNYNTKTNMVKLEQATNRQGHAEILQHTSFTNANNFGSLNSAFQEDYPICDASQTEINSLREIVEERLQTKIDKESVGAAVRLLYDFNIHDHDIYATIMLGGLIGISNEVEQLEQCREYLNKIKREDFVSVNALFARFMFHIRFLYFNLTHNPNKISDARFKKLFFAVINDIIKATNISSSKLTYLLKQYDKNSEFSYLPIEFLKNFNSQFENNQMLGDKNLKDIIFQDKLNELVILSIDSYAEIIDEIEIYNQQFILSYYTLWGFNLNDSSRMDKLIQYLKHHIEKVERKKTNLSKEDSVNDFQDYEFSIYFITKIYCEKKADNEKALFYAKKLFNLSSIKTMYGHLGKVFFYKIIVSNRTLGAKIDSLALEYSLESIHVLEHLKKNLPNLFLSSDIKTQIDSINSNINYFEDIISKLSPHLDIKLTINYPNFNSQLNNTGTDIELSDIFIYLKSGYTLFIEDKESTNNLPPNNLPYKMYTALKSINKNIYVCYAYLNGKGNTLNIRNLINDNHVKMLVLSDSIKKIRVKAFLSAKGTVFSSKSIIDSMDFIITISNVFDRYSYMIYIPLGLFSTCLFILCNRQKPNHKQTQNHARESLLNELKQMAAVITTNEWSIKEEQVQIKLSSPKKSFITNDNTEIDICENNCIKKEIEIKFIEILKELCGKDNIAIANGSILLNLVNVNTFKKNMRERLINFIVKYSNDHFKVIKKDPVKEAEEEKQNHEQYNRKKISEKISNLFTQYEEFDTHVLNNNRKKAIKDCENYLESNDLKNESLGAEFKRLQEKIDNKLKHIQNIYKFLSNDEKFNNIASAINVIHQRINEIELINKQKILDLYELDNKISKCNDAIEKLKHSYFELNHKLDDLPKLKDELKKLITEKNTILSNSPKIKEQVSIEIKHKISLSPDSKRNQSSKANIYSNESNDVINNEKTSSEEKSTIIPSESNQNLEHSASNKMPKRKEPTGSSSIIEYVSNEAKLPNNINTFFRSSNEFSFDAETDITKETESLKAKLKNDPELQIVKDQLDILNNLLTKVGDYFKGNISIIADVPNRPCREDLYVLCDIVFKEQKNHESYIRDAKHLFELSIIFGMAYTIMKSAHAASRVFGYYKQCAPGHYEKFKKMLIEIRHFFVHKFSTYNQVDTIHDFIKYAENYEKILSSMVKKLLKSGVYNEKNQILFLKNLAALVSYNKLAYSNEIDAANIIKKIKLYLSIHAVLSEIGKKFIKDKGYNLLTYPTYFKATETYCLKEIGEAFSILHYKDKNTWDKFTKLLDEEIKKYAQGEKLALFIDGTVYYAGTERTKLLTFYQNVRNIGSHRFSTDNKSGSKSNYQLGDERYIYEDLDSITLDKLRRMTEVIINNCLDLFDSFTNKLGNNNNNNEEYETSYITNKPF